MKKITLQAALLCALLICFQWSHAQLSAGVAAGFTLNNPSKEPGQSFTKFLSAGGFSVSIPVQYDLSKHWSARTELSYVQKNISMERTGNYSGTWEKRYNNYLQLPLMAHYRTGEWRKLSAYLQAGLFAGYWISSRQQGAAPDIYDLIDQPNGTGGSTSYFRIKQYDEKYSFDSRKDQRFDAGAIGGIGLNYHYNTRFRFFLEARYSQSFNSYEKDYMQGLQRSKHQTASAMLGCMMNLFNTNQ